MKTKKEARQKEKIRNFLEDQSAKKRKKEERNMTFETPAAVGGTSSTDTFHPLLIVGLGLCYPVCRLLPTFAHRGSLILLLLPPLPLFPWSGLLLLLLSALGTTHDGCAALPTQLCLILVPLDHEPFGCLGGPPVPRTRIFRCRGPQRRSKSQY